MAHDSFHFVHCKLDAYRVAYELADLVMVITPQVPEGHSKMIDQVVRAATGAEALIAEGANRYSAKQKPQRFVEARRGGRGGGASRAAAPLPIHQ